MERAATLVLFAKFPTPGKVKTRLIPSLGADGAAQLCEAFLLDLAERIARDLHAKFDCVLCFDPPDAEANFRSLLAPIPGVLERFTLIPQRGAGLGERLSNALDDVRKQHGGAYVFIGTDAPDMPLHGMESGIPMAQLNQASIFPAADGGYVSITLPSAVPAEVFENIRWSTSETAQDQVAQLRRCGLDVQFGEGWFDVDEIADVVQLFNRLKKDSRIAPRTFRTIQRSYAINSLIAFPAISVSR